MTREEFATCLAYPTAAIGKQLSDAATEVYLELLGDLPFEILRAACKRVCLEHKWASFPSVAEIREAAMEIIYDVTWQMPPEEAWSIASRAAGNIDPDISGEYVVMRGGVRTVYPSMAEWALKDVPQGVKMCMMRFGLRRLINGAEPPGVMQAQFCSTYKSLATSAKRDALLPADLRDEIKVLGKPTTPVSLSDVIGQIGLERSDR